MSFIRLMILIKGFKKEQLNKKQHKRMSQKIADWMGKIKKYSNKNCLQLNLIHIILVKVFNRVIKIRENKKSLVYDLGKNLNL